MTICPFCEGTVSPTARKCRHCGEFLDKKLRRIAEERAKKQFPHLLHLAVTVLTFGLWFPCWMLMAIFRDRRVYH